MTPRRDSSLRLWLLPITVLICTAHVIVVGAAPAPVVWTLVAPKAVARLRPDEPMNLSVRATIEQGWYVYAMAQVPGGPNALRISVPAGQACALAGPVSGPKGHRSWDEHFEADTTRLTGIADFTVPLEVVESASDGEFLIAVEIRYQACSDTLCLPPRTATVAVPVEIRREVEATAGQPTEGR